MLSDGITGRAECVGESGWHLIWIAPLPPPHSSLREGWVAVDFNMTREISQFTTVSLSSKSRLLKIRNSWRGRRSWSNRSGFPHKSLLEQITSGANCNVHWQLKRRKNKQKKSANRKQLFSVLGWLSDMPSVRVFLVWTISSEAFCFGVRKETVVILWFVSVLLQRHLD